MYFLDDFPDSGSLIVALAKAPIKLFDLIDGRLPNCIVGVSGLPSGVAIVSPIKWVARVHTTNGYIDKVLAIEAK